MKRYIRAARQPKWWNSMFAKQVCDAYDSGDLSLTESSLKEWFTEYNSGMPPKDSDIKDMKNIIKYHKSINSCKTINASYDEFEDSIYDDCYEVVMEAITDRIQNEEYWNYDEVSEDVYSLIEEYCIDIHVKIDPSVGDKIHEDVMSMLDSMGYINHKHGLLLYQD